MNEQIRELWDNVMIPYLTNCNKEILGKINEGDYVKFYAYMVKNNRVCQEILANQY